MNSKDLLLILEKEREEFLEKNNNKDSIENIIKKEKELYMGGEYYILPSLFYLIPLFILLYVFPSLGNFMLGSLMGILSFLFISSLICVSLSIFTVKIFVNRMLKKSKYREETIKRTLENEFNDLNVSDEVFSVIKVLLTDDEYFQAMKENGNISNKKALEIAKDKILKDEILDGKKDLFLDLKKLKRYNVNLTH